MCFLNECEWFASINEHSSNPATKATKCNECGIVIQPGEIVHRLYQQEYEECRDCEYGYCECEKDKCCICEKPNYGETFDYDCCDNCDKFLKAIEASEIEVGCRRSESRPMLTMMVEDIREANDPESVRRYVKKALVMFPELKTNKYISRIAKKLLY